MNCFHFSVSLGYKTTNWCKWWVRIQLWIAFIFQYLWDTKQRQKNNIRKSGSCELLSFFSIFGIQNNYEAGIQKLNEVVNCFHFSVSLGYKTTYDRNTKTATTLWIAFIFQYLWDTKQLLFYASGRLASCELLSFFSIFGIQNNFTPSFFIVLAVVNCFHFSVSLGYKTTNKWIVHCSCQLWIAFIFQYLWDTKQLFF